MQFDLKRPCADCPFRVDKIFYGLSIERKGEIAEAVGKNGDGWFACHKTLGEDDEGDSCVTHKSQFCAGAMIVAEKSDDRGVMLQISERLGMYKPENLDMSAPVFDDFQEWIRLGDAYHLQPMRPTRASR